MAKKGQKLHRLLTPQQLLCVDNYVTNTSPTFGNKAQSYSAAGYKAVGRTRDQAACRFFARSNIKQEIEKRAPKTPQVGLVQEIICKEYAVNRWQELYGRAWIDHDNTTCRTMLQMLWQAARLLDPTIVIDTRQSERLDAVLESQAKAVAALVLAGKPLLQSSSKPVDAAFESDNVSRETREDIPDMGDDETIIDGENARDDNTCSDKEL
jgi:hypothetical protein